MEHFTLRQGDVVAKLSQVCYRPDEGFQEDNTWYVAEASISAGSDIKLNDGPGVIEHNGNTLPVTVRLLHVDTVEDEDADEDDEWKNPVCEIDISYAGGLKKLADSLGLL